VRAERPGEEQTRQLDAPTRRLSQRLRQDADGLPEAAVVSPDREQFAREIRRQQGKLLVQSPIGEAGVGR
jgi:hypothetical protein